MRSHAKAATAGSTQRMRAGRKPALLLVSLAACVATLALVVGPASGATTRFLVEVFGSSAQPAFPGDRGMAVDQATGELYVLETNTDEIRRYNADGTPSNFAALGANVIDGEGAGDETPEGNLAIASSRSESQIAIDESGGATDGNIYVTESTRDQVSIFSSEGAYLGELSEHSGGAFNEPLGVAVDPSGNVYVGDFSAADLVHKYEPAANPPVNGDNTASFNSLAGTSSPGTLAAGAGATEGFIFVNRFNGELFKLDATTGELKYQLTTSASTVYVDPGTGHVFVPRLTGSSSEVVEYDASGAAEATKVSAFKPGSTVEGTAVNSANEEVYVSRASTESVEVFGPAAVIPDVTTEAPSSNTGTRATLAGTVNPDGVELDECFFEWGENVPGPPVYGNLAPCAQAPAEIGAGTAPVPVSADLAGLTPHGVDNRADPETPGSQLNPGGDYEYRLVAKNPNATINGSTREFSTPETVLAQAASGVGSTEATLNGTVNPDGEPISECVFEWGLPKEPRETIQKYPEAAPCLPGPGGIAGTSPVAVQAEIAGLHPGTVYHFRLKATYPSGRILSQEETLQTTGPRIAASWSKDVVFTEAALKADIDPEGKATTYRFEYGTTEAYGSETPELAVGADSSVHTVTRILDGLQPGTTYHYRAVATNADAENLGPDQTFTTYEPFVGETDCPNRAFRAGPSAKLPDCRAYEMVSPVDKEGGNIVAADAGQNGRGAKDQAAVDGGAITYSTRSAFGDAVSNVGANQYLSRRGNDGWTTSAMNPSFTNHLYYPSVALGRHTDTQFLDYAEDLSSAWLRDEDLDTLTPDAPEGFANIYRRDNTNGTYHDPALTVEPLLWNTGNDYGPLLGANANNPMAYRGRSQDGSHVVFEANAQVTPDAIAAFNIRQIYERVNGAMRLVSVLPNGEPSPHWAYVGTMSRSPGFESAVTGGRRAHVDRAISEDGSRIFWTSESGGASQHVGEVYVRIDGTTTVPVSESVTPQDSRFWTASVDGSRAVFSFDPDGFDTNSKRDELYLFDVDTETPTLIAHGVTGVAGASEDLSHIYLVSREVLDAGASQGEENLYLYSEGAFTFIATDGPPRPAGSSDPGVPWIGFESPRQLSTRVTSDGKHIAFISERSLTGYDNSDAVNGRAAVEVFLYDADADRLTCVSCDPSGARPHGAATRSPYYPGKPETGQDFESASWWTAAWIPTWQFEQHAARVLSEDGNRVFFNAMDALVPQDTNGRQDVYQWEAQGTGSCQKAEGCVSLISTGTSEAYSEFIDASADGSEVFIRTASGIDPRDSGLVDIYAARVNGGFPLPSPAIACQGDACQNVPAPPSDPTPASAGFRGAGDPQPRRNCRAAGRRAAKLSKRAKRLHRAAKRSQAKRRSRALRKRSARFSRRAKRLSKRAQRCRRANRRAAR